MDPIGTVRVRHACKEGIPLLISYTKFDTDRWVGFYTTLTPNPLFAAVDFIPDAVAIRHPLACDAAGWVG